MQTDMIFTGKGDLMRPVLAVPRASSDVSVKQSPHDIQEQHSLIKDFEGTEVLGHIPAIGVCLWR